MNRLCSLLIFLSPLCSGQTSPSSSPSVTLTVTRAESPIPFEYIYDPSSISSGNLPSSALQIKSKSKRLTISYRDIYEKIGHFCRVTLGLPSNCKILLLRQLLRKLSADMSYPSPWLIDDVAKYSFTSDLIQAICQSNEYLTRFENEMQCQEQVEDDVRTKKTWLSLYEVLPLRNRMVENDLIVLKDWNDVIEGHTFGFYEKIKALSKIADDPRVTTICEIGYNFGHSVSILFFYFSFSLVIWTLPFLCLSCLCDLQTLNWLNSNPKAKIVAFDVMRYLYTSASLNSMYKLHPDRDILLITGNSLPLFDDVPPPLPHSSSSVSCQAIPPKLYLGVSSISNPVAMWSSSTVAIRMTSRMLIWSTWGRWQMRPSTMSSSMMVEMRKCGELWLVQLLKESWKQFVKLWRIKLYVWDLRKSPLELRKEKICSIENQTVLTIFEVMRFKTHSSSGNIFSDPRQDGDGFGERVASVRKFLLIKVLVFAITLSAQSPAYLSSSLLPSLGGERLPSVSILLLASFSVALTRHSSQSPSRSLWYLWVSESTRECQRWHQTKRSLSVCLSDLIRILCLLHFWGNIFPELLHRH